jgi:hypothetical protein
MPLLDHFRSPVAALLQWNSFHSNWASRIADDLCERLPEPYRAEEHLGAAGGVEIDIATYHGLTEPVNGKNPNHTSEEANSWQPPTPLAIVPNLLPESFEIQVVQVAHRQIVAAIELISPANKDRPTERDAFVSKVRSYLHQGVCVLIVDVITGRSANLHNELSNAANWPERLELPATPALYAATYRPVLRNGSAEVDVWTSSFQIGESLPTMPLRIYGDLFLPVELEQTYLEACRRRKIVV